MESNLKALKRAKPEDRRKVGPSITTRQKQLHWDYFVQEVKSWVEKKKKSLILCYPHGMIVITRVLKYGRRRQQRVSVRMIRCDQAQPNIPDFEDEGRSHQPRNTGIL